MPSAAGPSEEQDLSEDQQHIPAPRTAGELEIGPEAGPEASPEVGSARKSEISDLRLTEREREILAFEARWWKHAGSKEQAIRDAFGLSATRYYQVLNTLLDKPAATEHDPVLVGRLRRLRATRARTRRR